MRAEEFNQMVMEVFAKVESVLVQKAGEYADDVDRLRNFKQAAHLKGETQRKALAGMMAKHTVSCYDLMMGDGFPSMAMWDEKIIDHINYLILLRGIVIEELRETEC